MPCSLRRSLSINNTARRANPNKSFAALTPRASRYRSDRGYRVGRPWLPRAVQCSVPSFYFCRPCEGRCAYGLVPTAVQGEEARQFRHHPLVTACPFDGSSVWSRSRLYGSSRLQNLAQRAGNVPSKAKAGVSEWEV